MNTENHEAYISQFKPDDKYLDVLDDVWEEEDAPVAGSSNTQKPPKGHHQSSSSTIQNLPTEAKE